MRSQSAELVAVYWEIRLLRLDQDRLHQDMAQLRERDRESRRHETTITLSVQLLKDCAQAKLARLRANQEAIMASLNVQLAGYKLSPDPSSDEDHLEPTPGPSSASAGDVATRAHLSHLVVGKGRS